MGVFDNYKLVNGIVVDTSFVQWVHPDIPNSPEVLRWIMRVWALLLGHCLNCTALSGCYFAKYKTPGNTYEEECLLHPKCHCRIEQISNQTVKSYVNAYCPIEKFTKYIFADKYIKNGKKQLFEMLGFTIDDANYLKSEYEIQAKQKYTNGDYMLSKLDMFGQNINITINLKGKNGRNVDFISGWKIYPDGLINCNTPLGDK